MTDVSIIDLLNVLFLFTSGLRRVIVIRCATWYHLYNLKSVKNTHGGVLPLVKLQASANNFAKSNTPPLVFFKFFKLCKWYQIVQWITIVLIHVLTSRSCNFLTIWFSNKPNQILNDEKNVLCSQYRQRASHKAITKTTVQKY